jgi:murein DD-endopeptidase MepM/ murein hydrolase activator NlpD
MGRYFTVMVIPEREKGVKTFRIPRTFFHAAIFTLATSLILLGILVFDYWEILRQVYKNKHLTIENRQLKEQIQLFHMKLNTLSDDIGRISTFEKKLKIITGLEDGGNVNWSHAQQNLNPQGKNSLKSSPNHKAPVIKNSAPKINKDSSFKESKDYIKLKHLYEQKMAASFGMSTSYGLTKKWNELTKQSFKLADQFAIFDYQFDSAKSNIEKLEVGIHRLDQFLLEKDSFLKSMPSLLPTKGWITSFYGPRLSHYSRRVKMHEGLDIGAKTGTPILAPADGRITYSGIKPGFGKFIQLDHGYGIETIYAHADRLKVKRGELIKRGQLIATVGSTGLSTGPHLHYEVRVNGTPVNPLYYVLD